MDQMESVGILVKKISETLFGQTQWIFKSLRTTRWAVILEYQYKLKFIQTSNTLETSSTSSICQGGGRILTKSYISMSVSRVVLCSISYSWSNKNWIYFGHLICAQSINFSKAQCIGIKIMFETSIDYNHIVTIKLELLSKNYLIKSSQTIAGTINLMYNEAITTSTKPTISQYFFNLDSLFPNVMIHTKSSKINKLLIADRFN